MRTLRTLIPILLTAASAAMLSAQQPAPDAGTVNVAVFPLNGFMPGEDGRELAAAFRAMVISELSSGVRLRLVERESVDELLQAQQVSLSGSVSDAQAIRVGQILGAQYAVTGGITVVGRDARLDLRLVDIETGEIVHPFKDVVGRDRLLTLVDRVAEDFASRARVKPRVADVQVPPAAVLAYARGLDFEKRGRTQEAARMYRRALELFPEHPHARAALQRVN